MNDATDETPIPGFGADDPPPRNSTASETAATDLPPAVRDLLEAFRRADNKERETHVAAIRQHFEAETADLNPDLDVVTRAAKAMVEGVAAGGERIVREHDGAEPPREARHVAKVNVAVPRRRLWASQPNGALPGEGSGMPPAGEGEDRGVGAGNEIPVLTNGKC